MDLIVPEGEGREALLRLAHSMGWDQAQVDQYLREDQEADEESRRYEEYLELIRQATEGIIISPADLGKALTGLAIDPAQLQEQGDESTPASPSTSQRTPEGWPQPMPREEFRRMVMGSAYVPLSEESDNKP